MERIRAAVVSCRQVEPFSVMNVFCWDIIIIKQVVLEAKKSRYYIVWFLFSFCHLTRQRLWQPRPKRRRSNNVMLVNVCMDEFRMLWIPWVTHRKVWHKMAVQTAILCHTFLCVTQVNESMPNSSICLMVIERCLQWRWTYTVTGRMNAATLSALQSGYQFKYHMHAYS